MGTPWKQHPLRDRTHRFNPCTCCIIIFFCCEELFKHRRRNLFRDFFPISLSIHLDKADQLKKAGEYLRLYVTHGYITAYEVMDHANS